jgi:RNA polymerase sigma-70 factor (sigma-E family)
MCPVGSPGCHPEGGLGGLECYDHVTGRCAVLTDQQFTEFVIARGPALQRTAWFLAGSRAEGEDLLQQSLVKVYASLRRVRHPEALESYVRKVMTHTAISSGRRMWRHREVSTADPPEPLRQADSVVAGTSDELWPLILALSPRQRAVVALRFYEDLSIEETAQLLGCSIGTVKRHHARAMDHLRQALVAPEDADRGGVR